jgi:predicted transcriptional regulator
LNNCTHRHHLRLDEATQAALEELCRHTSSTKSSLMRRYVKEGVTRDAQKFADETEIVLKSVGILKSGS